MPSFFQQFNSSVTNRSKVDLPAQFYTDPVSGVVVPPIFYEGRGFDYRPVVPGGKEVNECVMTRKFESDQVIKTHLLDRITRCYALCGDL
jgi:hypothetical protein